VLVRPRSGPAGATLFEQVRVFDGNALKPPQDVLIVDGRIASGSAPSNATRVDGRGKTLLPGLIDCHVHLGGGDGTPPWDSKVPNTDAQAAALVYSGVTTILEASRDTDIAAMRRRIASGELAGPRIIGSSRIVTAPGGHPIPMFRAIVPWPFASFFIRGRVAEAASEDEARRAVDREVDERPSFIKIVYDDIPPGSARLSPAVLRAAIAEAHARGVRASVHIGSPEEAIEALDAGADVLMHVPADGPLTPEQARRLASSGVPIVTTSRVWAVLGAAERQQLTFTPLEKEVMPPGTAEAFAHRPASYRMSGFPEEYLRSFAERDGYLRGNVTLLVRAGARLVAGTDSGLPGVFHGAALHRELQTLVGLGVPPAQALLMATSEAARAIDPAADYGAIKSGMRADLVLIDGDPLADISATERILGVWQDGRRMR